MDAHTDRRTLDTLKATHRRAVADNRGVPPKYLYDGTAMGHYLALAVGEVVRLESELAEARLLHQAAVHHHEPDTGYPEISLRLTDPMLLPPQPLAREVGA